MKNNLNSTALVTTYQHDTATTSVYNEQPHKCHTKPHYMESRGRRRNTDFVVVYDKRMLMSTCTIPTLLCNIQ